MKNLKFLSLFLYLFLLSNCNVIESPLPCSNAHQKTEIVVQLPAALQSRAYGEATAVNTLHYAVYDKTSGTTAAASTEGITFTGNNATIALNLIHGKTYEIICWADNGGDQYKFSASDRTVTVDYTAIASNDDSRDAFFGASEFTVDADLSHCLTLKRPFAQLNIGTTDMDKAGISTSANTLKSEITVTAFSTLNLSTGAVSNPTSVTYSLAAVPGLNEEFPAATSSGDANHYYLSMNYVLTDANQSLNTIAFKLNQNNQPLINRTFNNIPLKRNFRTNIVGSLITDETVISVTIDSAFDGNL